jgi:hypothetical protein
VQQYDGREKSEKQVIVEYHIYLMPYPESISTLLYVLKAQRMSNIMVVVDAAKCFYNKKYIQSKKQNALKLPRREFSRERANIYRGWL